MTNLKRNISSTSVNAKRHQHRLMAAANAYENVAWQQRRIEALRRGVSA